MILFFKKLLKAKKLKAKSYKLTRGLARRRGGMTYVELIVVLSIFAILSTVVLFNYKGFEEKVEIRNLANNIALKMVDAQKSAISGELPLNPPSPWKPSYGVYFDLNESSNTGNKVFYYFIDLSDPQNKKFDTPFCPSIGECLDKIEIKNGNKIESIKVFYKDKGITPTSITKDLHITFTRPSLGADIKSNFHTFALPIDRVEIIISSSSSIGSIIKVYPSGRIQVN